MLKIRLQRVGRKHEPAFRLVLTDSKNSTKSGKFLEILGNFDARKGEQSAFKGDRILHWVSKGAQTSDTVHNLLVTKKLIPGKKINKLPKKSPIRKESAEVAAPSPKAEVEKPEVQKEVVEKVETITEALPEVATEAVVVEDSTPAAEETKESVS